MWARLVFGLLGGAIALATAQAPAAAADLYYDPAVYAEAQPDNPTACEKDWVLNRIKSRFAWAERNTWHRGFVIDSLVNPKHRYVAGTAPARVLHDHCAAEAIMTNGMTRRVYYIVEEGMGFASIGDGVDFCVLGLDPWRVYDADCRTMR